MNLECSVDKLYENGWRAEDAHVTPSNGLERLPDGRLYPSALKVQAIFASRGYELAIRYVQLFDCYRAVWTDSTGAAVGAVVGSDEREASVYALAQLLKTTTAIPTAQP